MNSLFRSLACERRCHSLVSASSDTESTYVHTYISICVLIGDAYLDHWYVFMHMIYIYTQWYKRQYPVIHIYRILEYDTA